MCVERFIDLLYYAVPRELQNFVALVVHFLPRVSNQAINKLMYSFKNIFLGSISFR